jgi:hypothetical protein
MRETQLTTEAMEQTKTQASRYIPIELVATSLPDRIDGDNFFIYLRHHSLSPFSFLVHPPPLFLLSPSMPYLF